MPTKKLGEPITTGDLKRGNGQEISCAEVFLLLDKHTRNHCYRVKKIALHIGRQLALDNRALYGLALSALFHDIGKITIDRNILTKKKPLTYHEIGQLRLHPVLGAKLWLSLGENDEIAHAILHHHERYDGNGYPANLDGEKIPLWSRIIAVADALDAMISERFYQAPLRPKVALRRIKKDSGKHFDPAIVKKIITSSGLLMKTQCNYSGG